MMKEKFFYIEPEIARKLLAQVRGIKADKRGVERQVYLIDEYAVLKTDKLKLRNVTVRDDDLAYFDEIVKSLMELKEQGVAVIPILGYCYDPESENGSGYIIQQRAKGEELYDDAIMRELYSGGKSFPYLCGNDGVDAKHYITARTDFISKVPQEHFNKFVKDIIILIDNELLVDFNTKCNFFYDPTVGFQFIDIDAHTDHRYGLFDQKLNGREIAAYYGFEPCHFATGTKIGLALDEEAISAIGAEALSQLALNNKTIFEKCKNALLNNGVSTEQLGGALSLVKIFGC